MDIDIDHIPLHIPAGQYVAIMGATGSGKTTLAQMISGLIQPHAGDIQVGPYQLNKKADRRRLWKEIGFLFQFPEHQVIEETVYSHIRSRKRASQQVKCYYHNILPRN